MTRSSETSGFYRKSIAERREFARDWAGLTEEEARAWDFPPGVDPGTLDRMIENVIGVMPIPLGVATHFRINEKDYLIPMAIEEPSVVAAASNSAKVARTSGGFHAQTTDPVMIGQVQIMDVHDPAAARLRILHARTRSWPRPTRRTRCSSSSGAERRTSKCGSFPPPGARWSSSICSWTHAMRAA